MSPNLMKKYKLRQRKIVKFSGDFKSESEKKASRAKLHARFACSFDVVIIYKLNGEREARCSHTARAHFATHTKSEFSLVLL